MVADLGIALVYKLNNFYFDMSLFNGQGYKQFDFTPRFGIWFRIDGVWSKFKGLSSDNPDCGDSVEYIDKWLKRDKLYIPTPELSTL